MTIPVGMASPSSLLPVAAIPAPTCQVWVTSLTTNSSLVIDSATSQATPIDIGSPAWNVSLTPDGAKAFMSTNGGNIKVIDVAGNFVQSVITAASFDVETSVDGTRVYSVEWTTNAVVEFSAINGQNTGRSATTQLNPAVAATSPDGSLLYVVNYNSSPASISKITTSDFSVTHHLLGGSGSGPAGVAVSPNGLYVYVVMYTGEVYELSASTMALQRSISIGGNSRGVVVNSLGTRIYVTSAMAGLVYAIDASTFQIVDSIPVGNGPQHLAISPDDHFVYVTNQWDGTISKIDTTTNAVVETISVNFQPFGIDIGPSNCTAAAQQQAPTPAPSIPIWRVSMDPAGGKCLDAGSTHDTTWTSVFVGYRYLPGVADCARDGHVFAGWADADEPDAPLRLPLLVDPSDGKRRWFVAANHSLVAVWAKVEESPELPEDLSGTAPGAFVGGPDRATAEGGGVVDGYYIPPRTQFGPWMLAIPR